MFLPATPALAVNHCNAGPVNKITSIVTIIDGDTVVTKEGETIRLIGIDTPELNYRSGDDEALALEAKTFLESLLKHPGDIGVVYDVERIDQYGRTLAHLFLADGTNVQEEILGNGLAVPFIYPPNLKFTSCYYEAVAQARQAASGLWGLPALKPLATPLIKDKPPAYRLITGKITQINESEQSLTIVLDSLLHVIIPRELMNYLYPGDINELLGNQTLIHGYVYRRGQNYGLRIHHPSQIKLQ